MKKIFQFLLLLCGAVFLSACQTDIRAAAVERARTYALKNTRQLSDTQRNFIRYTDPVIMEATIFRSTVPKLDPLGHIAGRYDDKVKTNPENDFIHTCLVWNPPEMDGASVVVDGAGERSMRAWTPARLIIKKFIPPASEKMEARRKAVLFLASFMPDLDFASLNVVRFDEPEYVPTRFSLKDTLPVPAAAPKNDKSFWDDYLASSSEDKTAKFRQISLVWTAPDGKKLVVIGLSPALSLTNWNPKKAVLISESELKQAQLGNNIEPIGQKKEAMKK